MVRLRPCVTPDVTLPGDLARTRAPVGESGEGEEEVRKAIEVDDGERGQLDLALEPDDVPFSAATDGARDMQGGRFGRAAGNDEGTQWLELQLAVVDGALELRDTSLVDACLLEVLRHLFPVG